MKCELCNVREKTRVKWCKYVCDYCTPQSILMPSTKDTVILENGSGQRYVTSAKRIEEMKRRVILPKERPDGGYYLGRRCENGKIQEKHPDY